MKVVWTDQALVRLEEIRHYVQQDSEDAAATLLEKIVDRGESLSDMPLRGSRVPELPDSDIRQVLEKKYRILYRVVGKQVQILTVFEGHRHIRIEELKQ